MDFLGQILDAHEIEDDDAETSIETLAKEYNKQDGKNLHLSFVGTDVAADATMKVSVEVLQRVYEFLQDQGQSEMEVEALDPDSHLHFIHAFERPSWHWSIERGTFEKCRLFYDIFSPLRSFIGLPSPQL